MQDALHAVEAYLAGKSFEEFQRLPMVKDAVERNIERVSEASRHLPDELKNRCPEIPWRAIADIGNVMRHAYDRVDDRIVWDTATEGFERLKLAVRSIIDGLDASS
jgi:uncharacterized protein with HEPN domain